MTLQNEWNLPPSDRIETIRLLPMELLLIDWILCTGSSLLQLPMDELRDEWHMFRQSVWQAYFTPDHDMGIMFHLSEYEAKTLLTSCPTTFSWGDGQDYGLSLKSKLAKMLLGTYTDPALTARVEAEQKAQEDAILAAENKLKTATTNLTIAENALTLSKNALGAKEKEARRLRDDTIRNAKADVQAGELKVQSTKDDLEAATREAEAHGIDTNQN